MSAVTRLEAWCDYVTDAEYYDLLVLMPLAAEDIIAAMEDFRRNATFRVEEVAILSDGRRLVLTEDRGYSSHLHNSSESDPTDPFYLMTEADVEAAVRTAVSPDGPATEEPHPWASLIERLRVFDVDASIEELRTWSG